jgi:hypothetical protein
VLDRDDAPGFYRVNNVRLSGSAPGSAGIVTGLTRGMDITGDIYVPDITTAAEAAFSRYQTAEIEFLDITTELVNAEVDYDLTLDCMPLVSETQVLLGDPDYIPPGSDVLVRAAVPCFLTVAITLDRDNTSLTVDEDAIANALVDYVNALGFPGKCYTSQLSAVVSPLLTAGVHLHSLHMAGDILAPTDNVFSVTDSGASVLEVPDEPDDSVTVDNVTFLLVAADVSITYTT